VILYLKLSAHGVISLFLNFRPCRWKQTWLPIWSLQSSFFFLKT